MNDLIECAMCGLCETTSKDFYRHKAIDRTERWMCHRCYGEAVVAEEIQKRDGELSPQIKERLARLRLADKLDPISFDELMDKCK